MSNLTDAERDELHHAVLRDVIAAGETVPNVHATAETIVAARVQAERDRLLARIQALNLACDEGCAGPWLCDGSCYWAAFTVEERAR